MRFSDVHCHVHLRAYNWLRYMGQSKNKKIFHPWVSILSNDRKRKKGKRANTYSQCDLAELWNGQVRLVFNVLYPLEKGFFFRGAGPRQGKGFMHFLGRLLSGKRSLLRLPVQGLVMDMPMEMVRFLKSPEYDYWQELKREVDFVLSKSGKKTPNQLFPKAWRRLSFRTHKKRLKQYPQYYMAQGVFRCPENKRELEASIQKEDEITMLLTIEGAHSFGSNTASIDMLLERVDELRSWKTPVFSITFAHHFDNKLCGHARSLPRKATYVVNQEPGMNAPINENGFKLLRKLLMLDSHNQPLKEEGYRILIDVKHMSARSRKGYYQQIIEACYQKGDIIPVIASHSGYSGIASLNELIDRQDQETYEMDPRQLFNSWSINITDEDVQMVFKTGGIIGLTFDQRILGVPDNEEQAEKSQRNNVQAFWLNLKAIVKVIYQQEEISPQEKARIWDCLCIGSDFDGYINPLKPYPTAVEFNSFARDLKKLMLKERQFGLDAIPQDEQEVQELVEKICYKNLENFAITHFPI